ncbi:hypothetical protein BU202_01875 [Streptococcus cuniculi]|uniref:Uncharacterized protein n=2 Tax=Streptococcus cuniculi TaxID=1432788 RepID=A0A1Q8EA51_9STRE|nr:hypothetical protein BU202_01875 [Streptococcus cuniculi]
MESGKFRTTREKSLAHEKFQVLQAISDIESGQVNSYFETAEAKNNLDKLIYQFYQAKNQVLLGNADKAKELFATVAHSNNDIYFVQKAREYLKEK